MDDYEVNESDKTTEKVGILEEECDDDDKDVEIIFFREGLGAGSFLTLILE